MTTLLGIDLVGRPVLVVGGGPVAARRAQALVSEGATVRVVAPGVCEDLADLVATGAVGWRCDGVREDDVDGVWLVHAATGDAAVDARVAGWAADRRVWCVTAGDAAVGTARTPAATRAGDVVVGVVSAGVPDPRRSREVLRSVAEHVRSGGADLRRRRPAGDGTGRTSGTGGGRVVLVGGGPGAVDLITVRGRRALAEADVVVTDRLGPTEVLDELPSDVEVVDVGKTPGHHPVPQHEINRIIVERAQRGQTVVRLKGGDPFVYGRGGEEVLACREAGVEVEVVPGVSSALAAPLAAGIPLTHRGTVTAFHVVNGHDGLDAAARLVVREGTATLVVLMGVAGLADMVASTLADGADPATPVAVVENGTTARQRVTRAPLHAITERAREAGVRAPAVIVIGHVASPDLLAAAGAGSAGTTPPVTEQVTQSVAPPVTHRRPARATMAS